MFLPGGEPRLEILRARPRAYMGVDLGQSRDHAAIVVIQRFELALPERDPFTGLRPEATVIVVRYAEQIPLGLSYPAVAAYVTSLAMRAPLADRGQIVVDATGVGAPVVDLLRADPSLKCPVVPVVITPGEFESEANGRWHVPKRDLLDGIRIAFEGGRIAMASNMPGLAELVGELENLRPRKSAPGGVGGNARKHDDLALALALAWWRASRDAGRLG
jgi:hypothetical protein